MLDAYGCPVSAPRAVSTCGSRCRTGRWADGWALAESLAADGGLLVSPGDLYGVAGADHVRVALVQPMERLALVGERLR